MIGSLFFIEGNYKKASLHYSQAIDKFNKLKISPPLNIKLSLAKSLIEINDKKSRLMLVGNGSCLKIKELLSCAKNYNIEKRVDILTNETRAAPPRGYRRKDGVST